jgi:uncharacterized membrane protein affecting hemolysin expression
MVGVGLEVVVIVVLLILSIGLQLEARFSTKNYLEDYDQALDEMRNSLNVVAQVLHKLPEMVPQFSINENPLSQILQFFQQRAEQQNPSEASLDAERLREPNGTFRDGEKETKEI